MRHVRGVKTRSLARRALPWLLLVAAVVAIQLSPAGDYLSLEALAKERLALLGLVERAGWAAPLLYLAAYVLVVSLAIPGVTILTLAGGMMFGWALGAALTVVAATIGAVLVFLAGRFLFGAGALERLGPAGQRIAAGLRRDAVSYLLVLRLVPLFPFVLVNLVPAWSGIRLRVFAPTTFLGIIPATTVYSLAGAGLGEALAAGGDADLSRIVTPEVLGALLGLAALALAAIPLRRWLAGR
ncbi:TVP38/TMEM64 family protein [Falsiroseomonas sp. HW251]|uniref:TVP38/TMEM64 family protein n=1 Tax=Falsiroseomonas sp. HW251 TaxID=3390998 RepID=UPI003D31ADF6